MTSKTNLPPCARAWRASEGVRRQCLIGVLPSPRLCLTLRYQWAGTSFRPGTSLLAQSMGSNSLRGRYGRHCRPGATHRQAAFAFQLAREATGKTIASYRAGEGSRDGLMLDPLFAAAFAAAKDRIRAMEYRYVEETDQNRQALLEIYCALVLQTPYNDFSTLYNSCPLRRLSPRETTLKECRVRGGAG